MIKIQNYSKKFKNKVVFQNVDLDIQHKGFYYIMGKNGAGKTTFLNSVLGFETFQGIIQVRLR
ncbi:hypothetical protein KKC_14330 [Listeria fleischmannii subsp. coloradonensis]|nr:hypothetical protein KKC_14330 [Listeria fleischmannii subsp. coloradonensis]